MKETTKKTTEKSSKKVSPSKDTNSNKPVETIGKMNIAIIDVDRIVAKSSKVRALKEENEEKNSKLQKWLKNVKKVVDKPTDKNLKNKLLKKYDVEFAEKQEEIRKEYAAKLKEIDIEITSIIAKQALANNFDLVLSRSVVVCGGTDITSIVEKYID